MTETELKNKVISWFEAQNIKFKNRPCRFTPKEVAEAVGGAYGSLGKVSESVVSELVGRSIKIRYLCIGNRRYFELL